MSISYEIPFIFDSGDADASQITSDGSQFTVNLETPLVIPRNASYCYMTIDEATVWWTVYNIISGVNDKIYVEYDDGMIVVNEILTLIPGLYDVTHLNAALQRELTNNASLPSDLFNFVPDTASSRVAIQFNYSGTQLDFTQSDTFREILGFNAKLVPLVPTTTVEYELGDNVAQFNQIDYFTIGSDILQRGIRINSRYDQTLIKIPITVSPGSQVVYQPNNLKKIPCNELIGQKKKEITFWLTDNNLKRVDTNGESFTISLSIHYIIKDNNKIIDY
jgi:hypothetical protein